MADFSITDPNTWNWGALGTIGAGAALGTMNGASQTGTQTSTTAPWAPQQPYLQDLYGRAQTLSQQPYNSGLQQQALAGMQGSMNNPLSGQAQGVISNTLSRDPAQNFGIGMRNPYMGAQTNQAQFSGANASMLGNNPYLDGGMSNPYLQASVNAAQDSAMRGIQTAQNQANRQSGSFGNSGVADTYGRAAGEQLGNIANQAYMNQFNTNLGMTNQNNQFNTSALNNMNQFNANAFNQNQQFNSGLNAQDIARNAQYAQTGINNDISQFNQGTATQNNAAFNSPQFNTANMQNWGQLYNAGTMDQSQQWNPLKNYGSLITSGSGSQSTSPIYGNSASGALGGALAGSSIYSNLFNTAK